MAFNSPQRNPKDIDKALLGYTFRMRTTKNKTASPQRRANVPVRVDEYFGVDLSVELAELGKTYDVFLNKDGQHLSGGHWHYQGDPVFYTNANGKRVTVASQDSMIDALDQDPALRATIEHEVKEAMMSEAREGRVALTELDNVALFDDMQEEAD